MKTLRSKYAWVAGCLLALTSSVSPGHVINPVDDDGHWGFEIGNGRKLVQNLAGKYGINVPEGWESFLFEKFTEVAPNYKGAPRGSIQINVVDSHGIGSAGALVESKREGGWSRINLNDLEGIKKEDRGNGGYRRVAIELCKGKELILINLEGNLQRDEHAPFNQLYESLKNINQVE